MNGGNHGTIYIRPLVGRTIYSRIKDGWSDPQGVVGNGWASFTPSRSGLTPLRRGGYNKSDLLAEVIPPKVPALSVEVPLQSTLPGVPVAVVPISGAGTFLGQVGRVGQVGHRDGWVLAVVAGLGVRPVR